MTLVERCTRGTGLSDVVVCEVELSPRRVQADCCEVVDVGMMESVEREMVYAQPFRLCACSDARVSPMIRSMV